MRTGVVGFVLVVVLATHSTAADKQASSNEAPVCTADSSKEECQAPPQRCALYYAESAVRPGTFGLFSGVQRRADEYLDGQPDLMLQILDANKNEWSPWHDMVSSPTGHTVMESNSLNNIFQPGISSMIACSNKYTNVAVVPATNDDGSEVPTYNSFGVHRSKDATAGSFSYYSSGVQYQMTQDVRPGEELVIPCLTTEEEEEEGIVDMDRKMSQRAGRKILSEAFLQETGVCLLEQDASLRVGKSSIPGAGRGVFAEANIRGGQTVLATPAIHFDISQMEILEQFMYPEQGVLPESPREHNIQYTSNVVGHQLMLNYCFGNAEESDVLLLPFGPFANFFNHYRDMGSKKSTQSPNAYVRWSKQDTTVASFMMSQRPMELFSIPVGGQGRHDELLVLEFVALRDIQPGEEIVIDYGEEWENAYREVVATMAADNESYTSAGDLAHTETHFRTIGEEKADPYPENLAVACYFVQSEDNLANELEDGDKIRWTDENYYETCLVPCEVRERRSYKKDGAALYDVTMYPPENVGMPDYCRYVPEGLLVNNVPEWAMELVDQPYTSDTHLPWALRQHISLPSNFYPEAWQSNDPNPEGDFEPTPLQPGELSRIFWKDGGEAVTQWAFRVAFAPKVREVLLDYCYKMGITEVFRHVTSEGNGLKAGTDANLKLQGQNWYLQRPEKKWYSNLHWLSPLDNAAHEDYLAALGAAGFDEALKSIGETLNMDGLVAFHVTFIAVSQATRGYVHRDIGDSEAKVYNVIIPLELASGGAPELDMQDDKYQTPEGDAVVGRYRYQYDVGAMMGDFAMHGTSAVDYRKTKEMRLAATVYIADVNERNLLNIMAEYTQAYPPNDDVDLLRSWTGRHWKPNDPTARLPQPGPGHVLFSGDDEQGAMPNVGGGSSATAAASSTVTASV